MNEILRYWKIFGDSGSGRGGAGDQMRAGLVPPAPDQIQSDLGDDDDYKDAGLSARLRRHRVGRSRTTPHHRIELSTEKPVLRQTIRLTNRLRNFHTSRNYYQRSTTSGDNIIIKSSGLLWSPANYNTDKMTYSSF
ncbi:hypothetical protein CBL_11958 [Carabus blaptoides fortunei]